MPDYLPSSFTGAVALTGAAILGLLTLKYNDRAVFTKRRENIFSAPGLPLVGITLEQVMHKERFLDYYIEKMNESGALTMYASALGYPPRIMTIDPRNIEHILKYNFANYIKAPRATKLMNPLLGHGIFSADGKQWYYQRKTASAIFSTNNFRNFFTVIGCFGQSNERKKIFIKELNIMSERILDKAVENNDIIDFQNMIYKFTLETFVYLGFGKQLNGLYNNVTVPFAKSFDMCQYNCYQRLISPVGRIREALGPLLHPGEISTKEHIKIVNDFAYDLIQERKEQLAQGHQYKDLLSQFMAARNPKGEMLSDVELRDAVLNFIIAGRDTTAQTLTWAVYYLLVHPRAEEKMMTEIKEHLTEQVEQDPPALYQAIKKMVYCHAVFNETLRLEPPVPSNSKLALEDDILPDGTHVRKGDQIHWCSYAMGRSTKLWGKDAREFKPERWIDENGELRREPSSKWVAFHAGPRVCLGQNLATLEGLVTLAFILKRYKFTLVPDQEIVYIMSLTHPMKNGLKLYVKKRQE